MKSEKHWDQVERANSRALYICSEGLSLVSKSEIKGAFTLSPIADADFNLLVRDVLESRNSDFLCQMVAVPIDIHVLAHFVQI
jgi:hypothetical protein